jgi:hypothetical protein
MQGNANGADEMDNTLIAYWESKADKHHANVEKLVARYENATAENYKAILEQIKKEEALAQHAEGMFDKCMEAA